MPTFESGTLAIGLIFPYQNPVADSKLKEWLEDNDYNIEGGEKEASVNIGPATLEMGGRSGVAEKEGIQVLHQSSANLNNFPNSSFITAKNVNGVEFSSTLSASKEVYSWLEDDIGAAQDIATIELTIEGLLRVDRSSDISKYFTQETLGHVKSLGESDAKGITTQFEARTSSDPNDWYRILIDQGAVGNPNLWGFKMVKRFEQLEEIDEEKESVLNSIDSLIDYSREE